MPTLIEIKRHNEKFSRTGYIFAENKSLLGIHQVDDSFRLNGYCVLRKKDIFSTDESFEKKDLITSALGLKNQFLIAPEKTKITSIQIAMRTAQEEFGVLVIHREKVCPGEVEVGTMRLNSETTYILRWLDVLANWENDDRIFKFSDVTLLEFGTEYEQTLFSVAKLKDQTD
jgi:hypothetical protein